MATQKSSIIVTLKDEVSKKAKSISGKVGSMVKSLATSKITFAAVAAAVGLAVKSFAEFETKIVNVTNLIGGTQEQTDAFANAVLDLATRVPQSANNLAESLFDVVSAGVEASEAIGFLETASKLATAGVTDTKTAVDGLTSVINAYGLEASNAAEISDKFFAAQVEGKTTIAELSNSVGRLAPIAESAGLSIDEMLASVTALTKQGIKTEEAVVAMRGALTSVISPTKEAQKVANALGIAFNQQALEAKGLQGFLADVEEKTAGNTEAMSKLFGNVRALNGVLALSKGEFSDLKEALDAIAKSTGAKSKAFEQQEKTISSQFKILTNTVNAFGVTFIDVFDEALGSTLSKINTWLKNFLEGFKALATSTKIVFEGMYNVIADWVDNVQSITNGVTTFFQKSLLRIKGIWKDTSEEIKAIEEERASYLETKRQERIERDQETAEKIKEIIDDLYSVEIEKTVEKNETKNLIIDEQNETEIQKNAEKVEEILRQESEAEKEKQKKAEEASAKILKDYEKRQMSIKVARDISLKEEIKNLETLLNNEKLIGQQREQVERQHLQKLEQLRKESNDKQYTMAKALADSEVLLNNITSLAKQSGNKDLFEASKAASTAVAIINGAEAVTKTLAAYPYPANVLPAAAVASSAAVEVATIQSQSFQQGGVVEGQSFTGDRVAARLNSGELVLTREDQLSLLDIIRGERQGATPGNQPIVVQVMLDEQVLGETVVDIIERERQGVL